jgi:hypothetical protein
VKINGSNRILFVKANSKSKNPILYIKSDKEYITYKSFLRKRKVKGGGTEEIKEDLTDSTDYKNILYKLNNNNFIKIEIQYDDDTSSYIKKPSDEFNDLLKNLERYKDVHNTFKTLIIFRKLYDKTKNTENVEFIKAIMLIRYKSLTEKVKEKEGFFNVCNGIFCSSNPSHVAEPQQDQPVAP